MILAALTVTLSVGFLSCSDDNKKKPEDLSSEIMEKWYQKMIGGGIDPKNHIEFRRNGIYSYVSDNVPINGIYMITESKKSSNNTIIAVSLYGDESESTFKDITLIKMLVQGGSDFDQMWVHLCHYTYTINYGGTAVGSALVIYLYSGNVLVKRLKSFFPPEQ
jgi:hypothetical protein